MSLLGAGARMLVARGTVVDFVAVGGGSSEGVAPNGVVCHKDKEMKTSKPINAYIIVLRQY